MSAVDLVGLVASRLCLGLAPELLCAQLLDTCLCKGSLDNMTGVLVCFPGTPRPCEEAIWKEQTLDIALGCRVLVRLWLASEDSPDLLPGGGLYCKASDVAEVSQLCQASGEHWEKGQNETGKATGTHSSSALDLEA